MRLAMEDAVLNLMAPVIQQAAAELPAVVEALHDQLPLEDGPIGLAGGSAGGAAALLALAETNLPVAAVALINPASRVTAVVEAGERHFGLTYNWTDRSRAVAETLDFVARASAIAERRPGLPILAVVGEDDDSAFVEATMSLHEALASAYGSRERLALLKIAGLAHPLAAEPGIDPAPQTDAARRVDMEVSRWLNRYLS
jgi:pimeloyl-ACP methyl ester carboxylesterase